MKFEFYANPPGVTVVMYDEDELSAFNAETLILGAAADDWLYATKEKDLSLRRDCERMMRELAFRNISLLMMKGDDHAHTPKL